MLHDFQNKRFIYWSNKICCIKCNFVIIGTMSKFKKIWYICSCANQARYVGGWLYWTYLFFIYIEFISFLFFFLVCLSNRKSRSYYDKTRNFWYKNKSKSISTGNSKRSVFWNTVRRSFETRNTCSGSSSFLSITNVPRKHGMYIVIIICIGYIYVDIKFSFKSILLHYALL